MQIAKSQKNMNFIKLSDMVVINPENISTNTDEINYVDISSVKDGLIKDTSFIKGKENFPSRAKRKVIKGDILYSTVRPNLNGYARSHLDNITASTGFAVIRGKTDADTALAYYYLTSNSIKHKVMGICQGGNYPAFKAKELYDFDIPFFEKDEKEKIANFLSERESYLQSIQTLISKMEQRNQYYLHGLMSGSLTLNNNRVEEYDGAWKNFRIFNRDISVPEKFNPVKLSEMDNIEMGRGKVISKKDIENSEGGYPIYSSSVLNNGYFGRYSEYLFDEEMITWSVDGGGNFFYRPKHRFSITNVCGYIKPTNNLIETKYFYYLLKMQHSKFSFDYSNKAHPSSIKEMYYFTNASLEEQKEVARFLSKNEDEVNLVKQLYSKEKQVFQWLCEKLVSGEYRIEY